MDETKQKPHNKKKGGFHLQGVKHLNQKIKNVNFGFQIID